MSSKSPAVERGPTAVVEPWDEVLRPDRLGILGLQHVVIMYAGTVAVPLIVGNALKLPQNDIALLVSADLFVCGIATLIQSIGLGKFFGVRLPVVAGATFAAVTPMILIATAYDIPTMYGAVIASGIFGVLIARPFASIMRFFPPVVTGTVITVIGLSLIGAGAGLIAGNDPAAPGYGDPAKLILAAGVVIVILLTAKFGRGFVQQIAVLLGLLVGTAVAAMLGLVDFSSVTHVSLFGLTPPFRFGTPAFNITAILSMCVVTLVTYTESTADMLAVAETVGKKLTPAELARGLATDGLSGIIGGVFNSFPDTAYAQNVGLVTLTKVRSRWVVAVAGAILLVLGVLPPLGQIIASLPGPVIGGAALVMFATVTAVGIRTLNKVQFEGNNNLLLVATSIGVGMLPTVAPAIYKKLPLELNIILGSSITSTVIVAFTLNLFFNYLMVKRGTDGEPVGDSEKPSNGALRPNGKVQPGTNGSALPGEAPTGARLGR